MRAWVLGILALLAVGVRCKDDTSTIHWTKGDLEANCRGPNTTPLFDFIPEFGCLGQKKCFFICQRLSHQVTKIKATKATKTTSTKATKKGTNKAKKAKKAQKATKVTEDVVMYISLFSTDYKMSVFSAAVIEKANGASAARPDWTNGPVSTYAPLIDYSVFSDFDRGHLFPYSFAKDNMQGKATMRLSNAVPQDGVFNKGVWKWAETQVRTVYVDDCLKQEKKDEGYKAILITGAVPEYFGDGDVDMEGSPFKIGKTKKNVRAHAKAKAEAENPVLERLGIFKKDNELSKKMTVPTHMWTEFVCFKENPQPEISSRISFIGLNYRTGVVKLYDQGIYDTLEKMYENSKLGQITPGNYMRNLKDMRPNPLARKDPAEGSDLRIKICEPDTALYNLKDLLCGVGGTDEHIFWDNVDIQAIRDENEKKRLGYLLAQYRSPTILQNIVDYVNVKLSAQGQGKDTRKKRSTDTGTPQNVTRYSLDIFDEDLSSNFKLKDCKIWEESEQGEVLETHVYDFETNTLIEDNDTGSGSILSANYTTEAGVEEEAAKVNEDEWTQDDEEEVETISIVLRPRKG